jgi:glutathione S-transferase
MSDEIVFFTNPMSRGRIVRWMLEELGRPYRTEVLAYGPAMKAPAYRAINPMGKVPAIVHGAAIVTEAGAICAYLADAFPDVGLAPPPGDSRRGAYLRWLFFGAGPVEAAVTNAAMGFVAPEGSESRLGYGSLAAVTDVLEGAVARGDYLLGDRFSAADVYLGSQIGWGMMSGTIEKRPALERYAARLRARPAARQATALDDALLPGEPPRGDG